MPSTLLFLLLFVFTAQSAAQSACPTRLPNPPDPRIVGGQPSPPQVAAFLAALFNDRARFRCSATIIAPGWLLTARHCGVSTNWTAILSTADRDLGVRQPIAAVVTHPQPGERFDLTLIQLQSTPDPASNLLPLLNSDPSAPRVASFARAVGYGRRAYSDSSNTRLRQVDVPIVNSPPCNAAYGASVVDSRICAGYEEGGCDSCTGDSGGPLLQYDAQLHPVVLGVVSAGKDCALRGFPGLYAPIQPVLGWMRDAGVSFKTGTPNDGQGPQTSPSSTSSPSILPSPSISAAPASSMTVEPSTTAVVPSPSAQISPQQTPTSVVSPAVTGSSGTEVVVGESASPSQTAEPPSTAVPPVGSASGGVSVSGSGGSDNDDSSGTVVSGAGTDPEKESDESDSGNASNNDNSDQVNDDGAGGTLASPSPSPVRSAEASRQNASGGLSSGSVAGIVVAGVAVGVLLVVASVCYVMMPRRTDAAVAV